MDKQTKMIKQGIKEYFFRLFEIRSDMLSYEELNDRMEENTAPHGANSWILMMGILMASIGLSLNSIIVIIGAKLISPFMGRILAIGYSLGIRDISLLKRAAAQLAMQIISSLLVSTIYFTLFPLAEATSLMLALMNPTLLDVMIAVFGGIAASIGNTRKIGGNVIPGAAVAVALMPPLCTAGYGIAAKQLHFTTGAFYLFAINVLFITLSAFAVTRLSGAPVRQETDEKKQKHISRMIAALVVVLIAISILSGAHMIYKYVING